MNKKIDTHIHGNYSSDSVINYRDLCEKAVERNYSKIIFTEHYDLLDTELTRYGLLPLEKYFEAIDDLKEDFPSLEIVTGIELGEPHKVKDLAQKILNIKTPEYIIGSLHVTRSNINVSLPIERPLTADEIKEYYEENLEMVTIGGFDTLGHLGIYKRGLKEIDKAIEKKCLPIIDEIFRIMIKNGICLEVNYSSFKASINTFLPEPELVARYKKLGGNLITIGSDAHHIDQFDKYYDITVEELRSLELRVEC